MKYLLPICLLAVSQFAFGVPTEINYQGRLTDGDGNPATGSKTFGLKIYDAATGGNELYSETIGSVTVDENGVYNFQFGAGGTSTVSVSETLVVSDGSSTTFDGTPSKTPIDGTLSVTDSTYSWNEVDGNPGEQATATASLVNGLVVSITIDDAGSGYTDPPIVAITGDGSGATATATVTDGAISSINVDNTGSGYTSIAITIEEPPAPFVVNSSGESLSFTYEGAPTAGTEIIASYKANENSIVGALSESDSCWLELSINGDLQSPRERILSVPFATYTKYSQNFDVDLSSVQEKLVDTIYQADRAGFVVADHRSINPSQQDYNQVTAQLLAGESAGNLQVVREARSGGGRIFDRDGYQVAPVSVGTINLMMPIPSGYYWKATGLTHVYFVSFAQ